ncbi:MAG: VWA domain-containing protein, partial [Gemmatimonadaceae bacterium]
ASQTCLVCAVDAAAAELASARRRDGNVPVVVLLTDGRANPRPAGEAVDAAARAKAAGVTFFTIGLGDDVDDGALEAIAAPGGRYFRAPTADGLAEVYRQVAGRIPCPAGGFWGRR